MGFDSVDRVCGLFLNFFWILGSKEPEFPAWVLLGVCFGLAFGRGGESLLGIRQLGEA